MHCLLCMLLCSKRLMYIGLHSDAFWLHINVRLGDHDNLHMLFCNFSCQHEHIGYCMDVVCDICDFLDERRVCCTPKFLPLLEGVEIDIANDISDRLNNYGFVHDSRLYGTSSHTS